MRRAACLGLVGAATAMLFAALLLGSGNAHADEPTVNVAIDVDTSGNSDDALGPTETCNTTPLQIGETLDIDVVIRGVPAYEPPPTIGEYGKNGIGGYGFNLLFDPSVVEVTGVSAYDGPTILNAAGPPIPFVILDYDGRDPSNREDPPGTTGNVRVDVADLSRSLPSGDGVLTRITMQAVGSGVSRLDLDDAPSAGTLPVVLSGDDNPYVARKAPAELIVGEGSCADPSPGTFPPPTLATYRPLTPGPSPSPTPIRNDTLTLQPDAIPINSDSVVTVQATADSYGIANYGVDVILGPDVDYISCSAPPATTCALESGPGPHIVEFGNLNDKPQSGNLTIGQLTVRAKSPDSSALTFGTIMALDTNENDLAVSVQNGEVAAQLAPAGTPTPTLQSTASPTVTVVQSPTPTLAASQTPASLPDSGGPLSAHGWAWTAGAGALLSAIPLLGAFWVVRRRRLS